MSARSGRKPRRFSAREARALVWLLPVLAVVSWLVWSIGRPGAGDREQDTEIQDAVCIAAIPSSAEITEAPEITIEESRLFVFDPNTIEYHDLVRLGFSRGEALGIIKYRERGKIFEIPEDFAACYQVSEDMYHRLASYIRIGEKYRLKRFQESRPARIADTVRDIIQPLPKIAPVLINLNTADSAALISVSGIGEVTVMRIIEHRTRLGGFVRAEQLAEVRGVTEQNYERIMEQIFIDDSAIQKIDINFAPAKSLATHPYIRAEALRKLLKQRQLKGGWSTAGELENDNIFTPEELAKLGPYLLFKQ